MARKVSEREKLLSYALKATDDQLREAIETFRTVLRSRVPAKERKRREAVDTSKSVLRRLAAQTDKDLADAAAAGKGAA